jgi:hypothetical protein
VPFATLPCRWQGASNYVPAQVHRGSLEIARCVAVALFAAVTVQAYGLPLPLLCCIILFPILY